MIPRLVAFIIFVSGEVAMTYLALWRILPLAWPGGADDRWIPATMATLLSLTATISFGFGIAQIVMIYRSKQHN